MSKRARKYPTAVQELAAYYDSLDLWYQELDTVYHANKAHAEEICKRWGLTGQEVYEQAKVLGDDPYDYRCVVNFLLDLNVEGQD